MNNSQFENNTQIKENYEDSKRENDDNTPFHRSTIVPLAGNIPDRVWHVVIGLLGVACILILIYVLAW
jgi:hypothetical protein